MEANELTRKAVISADTCARLNALLKYSNCKMFLPLGVHQEIVRVETITPNYGDPGTLVVEGDVAFKGKLKMIVDERCRFTIYLL